MSHKRGHLLARLVGFVSIFLSVVVTSQTVSYAQQPVSPTDAEAARNKCDELASHPGDPDRYLAGVPDEQLAPGPAREACEQAVRLNPDVARLWFQLGRTYWSVGRDTEAFKAFNEAARRGHAAAKKYLGDAYFVGRGLPSGQIQDAQRALVLYRQAAEGRFRDALVAIREVEAKIRDDAAAVAKAQAEADANRFNPQIFQNSKIMSALYYANVDRRALLTNIYVARYIEGLFSEAQHKIIFLEGGATCQPLISGAAISNNTAVISRSLSDTTALGRSLGELLNNRGISSRVQEIIRASKEGHSDMLTLFNRYGCRSEVTKTIMNNINAVYGVGAMRSGASLPTPQPPAATPLSAAVSTPVAAPAERLAAGGPVPDQDLQAVRLAADRGDAVAQLNLGKMYEGGRGGLPPAPQEAARLYKLSAAQGYAEGQLHLAFIYERGSGVPKDLREAARLYRLAADQGNAAAQANLADAYERGDGLRKNLCEALRLRKLAAAQGNTYAQNALKRTSATRCKP